MSEATKDAVMTPAQFDRLAKIIYDRSGIHFPKNKQYVLESRLGRRLQELDIDDYDQYASFLSIGPFKDDEFQEMFNKITINETSFFRNEPQLDVMEKTLLPKLLEARAGVKKLRFWSAACSTGEEPFTMAMQLHRSLGMRLSDWRIEILGTDISEKALQVAHAGKYTDYAIRTTPSLVKQRYFRQEGLFYHIDPTIKSMVNFEMLNLKDRLAAKRFGKFDVIFCRNVMIYFDDQMRKQVVNMFADQLNDDGVLFIGHSETLRTLDVPFDQVNLPQGFCYTKKNCKTLKLAA
jgi:chemotaxis protein methyltransferase CheR